MKLRQWIQKFKDEIKRNALINIGGIYVALKIKFNYDLEWTKDENLSYNL